MSDEWYYAKSNQQFGPVTSDAIADLARRGEIGPVDLLWRAGMVEWKPASEVLDFSAFAAAHPFVPGTQAVRDPNNPFAAPESDMRPEMYQTEPSGFLGYAGFWKRVAAAIIDGILLYIISTIATLPLNLMTMNADPSPATVIPIMILIFAIQIVIPWLYEAFMESSTRQATLGKMALGIAVTDLAGRRISFLRATGRHFAKNISALTLGIGFMMAGFTERKQALHDMIASTLVVNRR